MHISAQGHAATPMRARARGRCCDCPDLSKLQTHEEQAPAVETTSATCAPLQGNTGLPDESACKLSNKLDRAPRSEHAGPHDATRGHGRNTETLHATDSVSVWFGTVRQASVPAEFAVIFATKVWYLDERQAETNVTCERQGHAKRNRGARIKAVR